MSLPFVNQTIQTVQMFPLPSQTQELRNVHAVTTQLQKPFGKFKIDNSFWNQDLTKIEIEISRSLQQVGFHYKPDPIHQFQFDFEDKLHISLALEDYRTELLHYYENKAANLWLRRRYLQRDAIKQLCIPQKEVNFYDPLVEQKSTVPVETYAFKAQICDEREDIKPIENQIKLCLEMADKLSNEKIYDNQRFEPDQLPEIQMSADDDLIFDRIHNRVYQQMPFVTQKHLKEYYADIQSKYCQYKDLDTKIYMESIGLYISPDTPKEYVPDYQLPVTMPALQTEILRISEDVIKKDMDVDNGALFLFDIDKHFNIVSQDQSQQQLMFLPYNLEHLEAKNKNFQQQTMQILNELKEEAIRKKQYRIRSSAHWVDSIQINHTVDPMHQIINQFEDTAVNSWLKFLLYHDNEKIIDKLNKDISLLQENQRNYPEIYFQFFLRYQKLIFLQSRHSIISIMHSLNVIRTIQKNINIYYTDLHNLQTQITQERIQKRQLNLEAFLTQIEVEEVNTAPTCPYICEEEIVKGEHFDVIDSNGYKILHEIVFKDLYATQERIGHLAAFTIQFNIKLSEISSPSKECNRQKVIDDLLNAEAQYQEAKCNLLIKVFPYLKHASVDELNNAISLMTDLIHKNPEMEYRNDVLLKYQQATELLQLKLSAISQTKSLKLILKILNINSLNHLRQINKYIQRDELQDKEFPYKSLYQDPILDAPQNLGIILRQLDENGNFNVFSLLQFLKLRRRLYKYSLRVFYLSQIYHRQFEAKGNIQRMMSQLEQIPNRQLFADNLNFFEIIMDEYLKIGRECLSLDFTVAVDNYKLIDYLVPLRSLLLIDFYLTNIIQINSKQSIQFLDFISLKERLAQQAHNNQRKSQMQISEPVVDKKSNAIQMLSQQFRGAMMVKQFVSKIQSNQGSSLHEFNKLLSQQCQNSQLVLLGLIQREEQISLNQRLPFVKKLFKEGDLFDELRIIADPFMIVPIKNILEIEYVSEPDKKQKIDPNTDADWVTTQKLKIEKNLSTLLPNKKQSKFKSANSPFSTQCRLSEPITGCQQLGLQIIYQLIGLYSSNCNVEDLIYFKQGLLEIEALKRNQLRLRRDLEGLQTTVSKIQGAITTVKGCRSGDMNRTILTYLGKLVKKYHLILLTTMMSSVQQFRSQEDYESLIRTLRIVLNQIQFRNASFVEKPLGQPPRIFPSISLQNPLSEKTKLLQIGLADKYQTLYYTNPNNQSRQLKSWSFEDIYSVTNPFMLPTKAIKLRTQRITYSVQEFFTTIVQLVPNAIHTLFTLFPQSKLIYYSTIQDVIITEAETILRDKCIFEVDDLFKYERSYRKIILLQLRYLVLSEFYHSQKCQALPFMPKQEDPCTQWLQQSILLSEQHKHKQTMKTGFLLNIASVKQEAKQQMIGWKQKNQKNYEVNARFEILPRLRLESFENQVFQLVAMLIASQSLIHQEGIDYYQQLNVSLTKQPPEYQIALTMNTFYNNFERDSLKIKTLNKGEAHVIADTDLEKHLNEFNQRILQQQKNQFPTQIQTENDSLKQIYNQKSLELKFAMKKLKFYESNINHIVESLVAQRTNDLIFENDGLKQLLDQQAKNFDIEKDRLRDKIKEEFQDDLRTQNIVLQELQSKFKDYRKGINMELSHFITEYKQDGLKRIKDKASEALLTRVNIDLDVEFPRTTVYQDVEKDIIEISTLFTTIKKMRTFYVMKEMCIREKYDKKIQLILSANSQNEELQQKIHEQSEKIEVLKDELIQNRKIITIMDNQYQILKRDWQKLKVDRFSQMREKGQVGANAYSTNRQLPTNIQQEQGQYSQNYQTSQQITVSDKEKLPNRPITAQSRMSKTQSAPKLKPKNILQMKYKI